MDESRLIGGVLRSLLGGRRKRSRNALAYLAGGRGGSLWQNPQFLLTAAGLAWGAYEAYQHAQGPPAGGPVPAAPPQPVAGPPPLPDSAASGAAPAGARSLSEQALRVVRLAVSAASADGAVSDQERAAILQEAAQAGVERLVEQELAQPRPLAEIVAGVSAPDERAALYLLAFGVARADEQVSGAERIYLAKLADLLALDPVTVERLERTAAERIDAARD